MTVVIQRDGTTRSRTVRLPLWALRLGTLGGAGLLAGLGLLAILYFPVARAALRVPGLERKVARLEAENAMVRQLSSTRYRSRINQTTVRRAYVVGNPSTAGYFKAL